MLFQNYITDPYIRMLLAALDSSPIGITVADPSLKDMPLTYANKAFEMMTGYCRDDIIGKNCRFLQGDKTEAKDINKIREAIAKKEYHYTTIKNYRKNGEAFWNYLVLCPIFDHRNDLEAYAGFQCETEDKENNIKLPHNVEQLNELVKNVRQSHYGSD